MMQGDTMESARPKVVKWFKVYCWVLAVLYILVMLFSIPYFIMFFNSEVMTSDSGDEMPPIVGLIMALAFLIGGLVLLILSLMGVFLTPKPWVWVFSLVVICFGMTSACFLPFCIPLLIFWLKPAVKDYYGKSNRNL